MEKAEVYNQLMAECPHCGQTIEVDPDIDEWECHGCMKKFRYCTEEAN